MNRIWHGRKNMVEKDFIYKKYPANIINSLKSVIANMSQLVVFCN